MDEFKEIAKPLTQSELFHADTIHNLLIQATKEKQISNGQLLAEINWRTEEQHRLSSPRIRKIIRYLRIQRKIPIIATSKGYFISTSLEELKKQSKSLGQRAQKNWKLKQTFDELIRIYEHKSSEKTQD